MDWSVLEEKSSCKTLGLTFSSKLDCWIEAVTFSLLLKLPPRKWSFNTFLKFLSPNIVLFLDKSTIHQYMEYCCQVWAGAPRCYLELLDKLQKWICKTVGPSLAASLEPLAHHQNVAS